MVVSVNVEPVCPTISLNPVVKLVVEDCHCMVPVLPLKVRSEEG